MCINCTDLLIYPAKQQAAAFPFNVSDMAGAAMSDAVGGIATDGDDVCGDAI